MARYIKSLKFNLEDGIDIPSHREHRSKKGRKNHNFNTTEAFFQYKKKKRERFEENDDDFLAI